MIFVSVFAVTFLLLVARRFFKARRLPAQTPAIVGVSAKFARLRERLRSPEWRRYGVLVLAGKVAAIGLLVFVTYVIIRICWASKSLRPIRP
jgi:hypothetical protein